MNIKVRIEVIAEGARDHYPAALAWDYETHSGDNMGFYGHEVQVAMEQAMYAALKGVQPFVRYRPDGRTDTKSEPGDMHGQQPGT